MSSRISELRELAHALSQWCQCCGADRETVDSLVLVVEELFSNSVSHGYGYDDTGWIQLDAEQVDDRIVVTLTDAAPAFDPVAFPPPDTLAPLAQRQIGGLGLPLVRLHADSFDYRRIDAQGHPPLNQVRISKRLTSAPPASAPGSSQS